MRRSAKSIVGKTPKFRLICVYPAHITFAEVIFAAPLIRAYKKKDPYALRVQYSKGDMAVLQAQLPHGHTWLGMDWSSFDSSIPAWLVRDAFSILRDQIDFAKYDNRESPTNADTLPRLWRQIINYFINTPVKLYQVVE